MLPTILYQNKLVFEDVIEHRHHTCEYTHSNTKREATLIIHCEGI